MCTCMYISYSDLQKTIIAEPRMLHACNYCPFLYGCLPMGALFFMSEVHGVFQLSGKIVALRRDTTYVNILKRHGYVTALVCEMHASLGL